MTQPGKGVGSGGQRYNPPVKSEEELNKKLTKLQQKTLIKIKKEVRAEMWPTTKDDIREPLKNLYMTEEDVIHAISVRRLAAKEKAKGEHLAIYETSLEQRHDSRAVSSNETLGIIESLSLVFEPQKTEIVTISTPSFGAFELDTRIFPPELRSIDRNLLLSLIGEKIEAGGKLYQEIIKGNKKGTVPAQEDISNLMWFLQAKAENLKEISEAKVGRISSGAFSLEDPQLHLTKYLESSGESYQRLSSHVSKFQEVEGGTARGIDFNAESFDPKEYPQVEYARKYLGNVLPQGNRTLLVSPLLASSGLINNNRVLLKMEAYGCASPFFKDKDGKRASRDFHFKDLEHFIGHTWEYLLSLLRMLTGHQNKTGTRKERVPSKIKNDYKKIMKEMKDQALLKKLENLSKLDALSSSGGIRIMYQNVKWLLNNGGDQITEETKGKLEAFCKMLEGRYASKSLEVRIGDEIIFGSEDLKPSH